ncbi:MAG: ROK family protein [Lactobacillales bacterium]|jgi:fructokinase|nr:ROK family protein [Lactobacillales bacterium]
MKAELKFERISEVADSPIRLGSIEAGGTKFILAVGDPYLNVIQKVEIPTTTPEETLALAVKFFEENPVEAIGIGSFGPIDINRKSPTYGHVLATPKQGWEGFDFLGTMKRAVDVPYEFVTDVASSVYGELVQGAARGCDSAVYYTIGTGIGGAGIQNGDFIGGRMHSEMGHMYVAKHPLDKEFAGVCPFHGDKCAEGLAAGPAIEARYNVKGQHLPEEHEVWDILAYYIAQIAYNTSVVLGPEKIIFGGGVFNQKHLMPMVHEWFERINNGYVSVPPLHEYIVKSGFDNNESATIGNFALALEQLKK